jgi:hypothetical protein
MSRNPLVKFNEDLGREICRRIAHGETLKSICEDDHMPPLWAVYEWNQLKHHATQAYVNAYDRARLNAAHTLVDEIREIADSSNEGIESEVERAEDQAFAETGNLKLASIAGHKQRRASIEARRMQIDVRKWAAKRTNRKVYGDRVGLVDETPPDQVRKTVDPDQVRKTVDLSKCTTEQLEAIQKLSGELPSVDTD